MIIPGFPMRAPLLSSCYATGPRNSQQTWRAPFLNDGGREVERLSYGELDGEARRIAAWLQARGRRVIGASCSFPRGSISSRRSSAACMRE